MLLIALLGQLNLFLAFAKALLLIVGQRIIAMRATHALNVFFALLFFLCDRHAASVAQVVMPNLQTMGDRHPLIKHKALALPQTLFFGNLFEVLQDTAFKVVHLLKALLQHVGRGFLAANTTGTKHGNFLGAFVRRQAFQVLFNPLRKFAECRGGRIHGPFKSTNRVLIVVASVDYQGIRVLNQCIPVGWFHIAAHQAIGVDPVFAHGHNFTL